MISQIVDVVKKNDYIKIALVVVVGFIILKFFYSESLENVIMMTPSSQLQNSYAAPQNVTDEQQVQLTSQDLLPNMDSNNAFLEQNPVAKLLKEQDLLVSSYHIGVNTQVQSNKLPYFDLRSAPPIPKETVGPWSQSSYDEPVGAGRRQLELGA